jgi:hypothetical protein
MSNTFKELAEKAAQMERDGESKSAASCWKKAGAYSGNEMNIDWCKARAEFCESRLWRGVAAQ